MTVQSLSNLCHSLLQISRSRNTLRVMIQANSIESIGVRRILGDRQINSRDYCTIFQWWGPKSGPGLELEDLTTARVCVLVIHPLSLVSTLSTRWCVFEFCEGFSRFRYVLVWFFKSALGDICALSNMTTSGVLQCHLMESVVQGRWDPSVCRANIPGSLTTYVSSTSRVRGPPRPNSLNIRCMWSWDILEIMDVLRHPWNIGVLDRTGVFFVAVLGGLERGDRASRRRVLRNR